VSRYVRQSQTGLTAGANFANSSIQLCSTFRGQAIRKGASMRTLKYVKNAIVWIVYGISKREQLSRLSTCIPASKATFLRPISFAKLSVAYVVNIRRETMSIGLCTHLKYYAFHFPEAHHPCDALYSTLHPTIVRVEQRPAERLLQQRRS